MIVRDKDTEQWFSKAVVHRHHAELAEAENDWRRILRLHRPDQLCSFDQGIYDHLTQRNLAALSAERGDHVQVRQLWSDVLTECPGDHEALAKLSWLRVHVQRLAPERLTTGQHGQARRRLHTARSILRTFERAAGVRSMRSMETGE